MRNFLVVLLLLAASRMAVAQQSPRITVRGTVVDTANAVLPGATVMLLTPKDSALVSFGRTDDKGIFQLKGMRRAPYILKVSYVGYLPLQKDVAPDNGDVTDMGPLQIKPIQKELLEVVVRTAKAPLSIRGDTIEYNANSFKVPPGSTVEELLRKLPGMQVDGDGNIRAQGQEVKKVLVDGKAFFGSDPKLATKNLPAEAISKVQVFNDKSEQSKITGVDDGKKEKAVNLELKESHRKGGFGKVTAGAGPDSRKQMRSMVRGNYNRFSQKEQFSVIGLGNNLNQNGLSWNDYQDFRGSQSFNWQDDGNFGFSNGGVFFFGDGDENSLTVPISNGVTNQGFSKNYAGGGNYNYDTKKTKISSSYFYNRADQNFDTRTDQETFLPNFTYQRQENSRRYVWNNNHRATLRLEQNFDSLNTLIVVANARFNNGNEQFGSNQDFFQDDSVRVSRTGINNQSSSTTFQLASTAIYRHKFRKKGRNFAASLGYNVTNADGSANQQSVNEFYRDTTLAGTLLPPININQDVISSSLRTELKSSLFYTEPISKKVVWETFYNFSIRNDKVDRDYYDRTSDVARVRNDSLSRYYTNDFFYNRVGSSLRYNNKGFNISGGLAALWFNQSGRFAGDQTATRFTTVNRDYFTLVPNASVTYDMKNNRYLYGGYSVDIRQPSTRDLQPVVDNSNPRYIQQGNPTLLPQLTKNVNIGFNSFNPASFTQIYFGASYGWILNQIVYNQLVDPLLVTRTTPVNINGGSTFNTYVGFGFPLKKTKATINFNTYYGYNKNPLYINSELNQTNSNNYNFGVRLDLTPSDKFTFYPNANWSVTDTRYSVNTTQNQRIYNFRYGADMNVKLPFNMYFNGNLNYQIYKNPRFGFNQHLPILNLAVYKLFLKENKGEIRLSAYDVFNKNQGITQQAYQNFVQTSQVQTLARYFTLSFTYNMRGLKSQMRR